MRRGGVYHPKYIQHVQPSVNTTMRAKCVIFRQGGDRDQWVPGQGNVARDLPQIWAGSCRIQPNIDWRARVRDFEGEYDATMAVRFDLPMHKNEFGAVLDADGKIVTYADDPVFEFGDLIEVTQIAGPGQHTLLDKSFVVRNALPSTEMFQHNLLCDVGTSLHG